MPVGTGPRKPQRNGRFLYGEPCEITQLDHLGPQRLLPGEPFQSVVHGEDVLAAGSQRNLKLEEINKAFDLMHAGESIRSVVVYD